MTSEDVVRYYEEFYDEAPRLQSGANRLELLRTQRVIERLRPPGTLSIADVGGGPGVYAQWLAQAGHEVVVVDPVPRHVEAAALLDSGSGSIASHLGDARALDLPDESFDLVLLLGPLYHLTTIGDRSAALAEAVRILRPGGRLFAAAISRFASFHDGLARGFLFDPDFAAGVSVSLETGRHENPTRNPAWFTDAHFHRPADFRAEIEASGLLGVTVEGLEGVAGLLPDIDQLLDDADRRALLLDFLDQLGPEPSLLGASAHLLASGLKPR